MTEKSKFGAKLAKGEKVTTIEITPPKGLDINPILEKAKMCADMGIDAINIPDRKQKDELFIKTSMEDILEGKDECCARCSIL